MLLLPAEALNNLINRSLFIRCRFVQKSVFQLKKFFILIMFYDKIIKNAERHRFYYESKNHNRQGI